MRHTTKYVCGNNVIRLRAISLIERARLGIIAMIVLIVFPESLEAIYWADKH